MSTGAFIGAIWFAFFFGLAVGLFFGKVRN